jgi:hypothetical protein
MNNRKNTILAVLLVLAVASLAYLVWASLTNKGREPEAEGTLCTADAIECPDGSWVGRSGPDCQFVCPAGTSTQSGKETLLQGGIGQLVSGLGVQITPTEVLEDSRCPSDVQCIQAGTVRVRATLVSGLGTSTSVFALDKSITTETEIVTLFSVTPAPESGKTIAAGEYRFTFKVAKRSGAQ